MSFIRSKLWELRQIKQGTLLFAPNEIELILGESHSQQDLTNRQSKRIKDAVEEIEFEAKRMDITVARVKDENEAAFRILGQVA